MCRQRRSSTAIAHREKELQRSNDSYVVAAGRIDLSSIEPAESPSLGAWGRNAGDRPRFSFLGSRLGCTDWTLVAVLLVFALSLGASERVQAQGHLLDLPDALTLRMAQVAKGEDGIDPAQPACVMRNRIVAGWSPWKVLNHFYAAPHTVSTDELARVRAVLRDGAGCDPDAYFQWSTSDVARVKPAASAWLYSANGNHYYRRDALKRG